MTTDSLFSGWHLMRWFRLIIGIMLAVQAVSLQDGFAAIVAVFFLVQAVTNTGCCGSEGCTPPAARRKVPEMKKELYHEVKQNENGSALF